MNLNFIKHILSRFARPIDGVILNHPVNILFVAPLSIFWVLCLFSSCQVDKFLKKDQYIVGTNKINLQNVPNRRTKVSLENELVTLYKQKDLPDALIGKSKARAWLWLKKQHDTVPFPIYALDLWFWQ